ncbi:hypothetical protein AVEN_89302-1 [Araneus ventricosus]|uniref:Uncharacterized protein n=1 Tax=Araneus ventricosus TaxID=182803 RepID=A0A4Y2K8X2_ARAVE|nr:hypothetical protein AVEN_89302-1 [Araneus ventricosus]
MATGNVDCSFPKRSSEFSRPFNFNFLDVELGSEFLDYSQRTSSNIMDNNVYADRPLTIQVLDNECHKYPTTSSSDNGNVEDSHSSSKETKPVQSLSDFLAMNKNNPPSVVRPELIHSVIPEELTINVDVDEGSLHSWRPNVTNSLGADIFLPQPLFDISPTADLLTSTENQDLSIPELPPWNRPVQNELSDEMDKIQISVNPCFPKNFQIQDHLTSQKALLNTVKYEVMNARRNKIELKEATDKLTYKLEERKMFQNSQDIKRLSEENARLRLECQCLCMEVDYYLKGQATEKEKFEYDWRKRRCYTTIYQGIERKFLPLFRHTTDGKEAWNILKTNFEPTSKARLAVLVDEFFELKFNPEEETIGIFCKRVNEKKTQVKEAGFEIPELLIALQLIRRLPAEYESLYYRVQTLYRLKDEEFNHREVEKELVNEAGRIQLKQKDLNLDYTKDAYTVGSFRLQETHKKSFEHSGAVLDPSRNPGQYKKISYPKGMGPFCDFCSRKGHDASKCYKKRNKEKKQAFASETSFCRTNQVIKLLEYRRTGISS